MIFNPFWWLGRGSDATDRERIPSLFKAFVKNTIIAPRDIARAIRGLAILRRKHAESATYAKTFWRAFFKNAWEYHAIKHLIILVFGLLITVGYTAYSVLMIPNALKTKTTLGFWLYVIIFCYLAPCCLVAFFKNAGLQISYVATRADALAEKTTTVERNEKLDQISPSDGETIGKALERRQKEIDKQKKVAAAKKAEEDKAKADKRIAEIAVAVAMELEKQADPQDQQQSSSEEEPSDPTSEQSKSAPASASQSAANPSPKPKSKSNPPSITGGFL